MHLVNLPEIRIREYPKGWVVEIRKRKWYRRRYWVHLIAVAGIESEPWYFKSFDNALKEATKCFRWDLIKGTRL